MHNLDSIRQRTTSLRQILNWLILSNFTTILRGDFQDGVMFLSNKERRKEIAVFELRIVMYLHIHFTYFFYKMVNNNLMFGFSYLFNQIIVRLCYNYIQTRENRFLGHVQINSPWKYDPNIRERKHIPISEFNFRHRYIPNRHYYAVHSDQNSELTL